MSLREAIADRYIHKQHYPHHNQQGPPPPLHVQQSRSSNAVHHQQGPHQQHPGGYTHSYSQGVQGSANHHPQEQMYYGHPAPYNSPSGTGTYASSVPPETPEAMAATQMSRPSYPAIYQTPQSNSPASVASPLVHDQHGRSMYGHSGQVVQQQPIYYATQQQYAPVQSGSAQYVPHSQQQHHQSMSSQPGSLLMSHQPPQHNMQHSGRVQQPAVINATRMKMESHVPQMQRPSSGAVGPSPHPQQEHSGSGVKSNSGAPTGGNPNAAPGPIPATTPLVVRTDSNGVQWIAFEYSRDRQKMDYVIRCDVESIDCASLNDGFKSENCVYPRACCIKDEYRGNRFQYESQCNSVGWALAELNPALRGKRGLIQRAVDSWRNSNQDPKMRSRRVRRQAKTNHRKATGLIPEPGTSAGMPPSAGMGPGGGGSSMGKPGMAHATAPQLHHHQSSHQDRGASGAPEDGSGDESYVDDDSAHHHHHHHDTSTSSAEQSSNENAASDGRQPRDYQEIPPTAHQIYSDPSMASRSAPPRADEASDVESESERPPAPTVGGKTAAEREKLREDNIRLFGQLPDDKKRKFVLVQDDVKGSRVRVRVTLDLVDPSEMPDSFRRTGSVFPRSWFPIEMQSPPPSAFGSGHFDEDLKDEEVGIVGGARVKSYVPVPLSDGSEVDLAMPRMRQRQRRKEIMLNELGYRMTWLQGRVFAGRTVFLQKALDCYRNKVRTTYETLGIDIPHAVPHFETRIGKRMLMERTRRENREMS